jgi:hypothetical protein
VATLEDQGVDGRIILSWIFRKWDRGIDCIDLAQDRDRWWSLANGGNEPSGSAGNFLSSCKPVRFSRTQGMLTCHYFT